MSAAALALAPALVTARLQGMLAWLDAGSSNARIELMGDTWPGAGVPGGTLLATITLASPCGSVHGDVLLLSSSTSEGPAVAVSGEARWARLVTADGLWALDCAVAVDAEGSTAGLLIAGTQAGPNGGALLYKGGRLPPVELALR